MNKTKMTLAAIGGAAGLVALVLAFMAWQASSAKVAAIEGDDETGEEGLDSVVSRAESLSRGSVYPCRESMTAIESNQQALVGWTAEARKLAARGDRIFPPMTAAAFKSFVVADAKRLTALPGTVEGKLAKPEFAFGPFKDYIVEGKMPADGQLAVLQRQWDDVAMVTEVLAQSGIAELLDVQFKSGGEGEPAAQKDKANNKKKAKPQRTAAKKPDEKSLLPTPFTYVFTFAAKPANLMRAINALVVGERFVVVDGFTFEHEQDAVADALNLDEKEEAKKASARPRGRGRGRGRAQVEEEKDEGEDKSKNGIVTDPLLDAPPKATLTVSVYDFGTLEETTQADSSEKKGASK